MFTDELFEKGNISYDIQDGKIFMIFKSEGKEYVKTLDSFKDPLKTALLDAYVPKKYHYLSPSYRKRVDDVYKKTGIIT
jgi:hypothetical protein